MLDDKIKTQKPWPKLWGFFLFFKSALLHLGEAVAGVHQMEMAGYRRASLIGSATHSEVEVCNISRS